MERGKGRGDELSRRVEIFPRLCVTPPRQDVSTPRQGVSTLR